MTNRKVVITGLGVVSSLGNDINVFWNNLLAGKSGATVVNGFDTSRYPHHVGCEVQNFNSDHITKAEKKIYGRASIFAAHAAYEAIHDANLSGADEYLKSRTGVIIGTTFGEAQLLEKATLEHTQRINKFKSLKQYSPNSLSVNIAKKFGLSGPNLVMPTACAAGNYAIGYGSQLIKLGKADVMIVGGSDPFSHASFSGFSRLGVMSPDLCRPFDKNRKGMLVGEGAGILILEEYEHAKSRRAKIYAELLSWGLSCDAHHMTIPSVDGITSVITNSLKSSNISLKDIDYICAHGTGTIMNDKSEAQAIRKLFYDKGHNVPVSSIKSMIGHTMGAASAIESISCVLAISRQTIPPTVNFVTKDPECDIDCVSNKSRETKLSYVLNNSLAFGGNNACIVLAKS